MKPLILTAVLALASALPASAENASDWKLDAAHSTIGFEVRHLGLSRVKGRFRTYGATIEADTATGRLYAFDAWAETASVDTGVEKRDAHLRSDDFLNAAKFPKLTLRVKKVTFDGDRVTLVADLTLRDHTQAVTFTGERLGFQTVDFGHGPQLRAGYQLGATVSRKAFGLSFGKFTDGIAVVSDEVTLDLEVQFFRPKSVNVARP